MKYCPLIKCAVKIILHSLTYSFLFLFYGIKVSELMNQLLLDDLQSTCYMAGVDVGHQFFSRAEMVALGFHSHWLSGIDYIGQGTKLVMSFCSELESICSCVCCLFYSLTGFTANFSLLSKDDKFFVGLSGLRWALFHFIAASCVLYRNFNFCISFLILQLIL